MRDVVVVTRRGGLGYLADGCCLDTSCGNTGPTAEWFSDPVDGSNRSVSFARGCVHRQLCFMAPVEWLQGVDGLLSPRAHWRAQTIFAKQNLSLPGWRSARAACSRLCIRGYHRDQLHLFLKGRRRKMWEGGSSDKWPRGKRDTGSMLLNMIQPICSLCCPSAAGTST